MAWLQRKFRKIVVRWKRRVKFSCIHTLKGHTREIYALCQLEGGLLASGSWDRTIKIWDPKQEFYCIHTIIIEGFAPIPALCQLEGGLLASGSWDSTIKVRQITTPFSDLELASFEKRAKEATVALISKIASPDGQDDLTCPITRELFQNPVVDNHGHTFEKKALEEYFARTGQRECPLSREPITTVTPNLVVKSMVDTIKNQPPVPTRELFERDSTDLADSFINQGKLFERVEEHEEALKCYVQALKYTQKSAHYAPIPLVFEKQKDNEKAALSYLHLSQYQMQESKLADAAASLQKACDLAPDCIELMDSLAQYYLLAGPPKKAAPLFSKLAQIFFGKGQQEKAIDYYQRAIDAYPDSPDSYEPLANLYDRKSEKAHVYLRGALYFLRKDRYQQAELFCKTACELYPEDPNTHFPYLELLDEQKRISELPDLYRELILVYEKRNAFQEVIFCYKKLIDIEPQSEHYNKIVSIYLNQKKPEDTLAWHLRWIAFHMDNNAWAQAEKVATQSLQYINAPIEVLEKLQTIYQHRNLDKLNPLLVRLGKTYEEDQQLHQAAKTYRAAWDRFQDCDAYFAYAGILMRQKDHHDEGLAAYKELIDYAYSQRKFTLATSCFREIEQIDPKLVTLSQQEKTMFYVSSLSDQLSKTQKDLKVAQEEIKRLQQTGPTMR